MFTQLKAAILAIIVASTAACAKPGPVTITAAMLVPPDKPAAARYRHVAVLPFEGAYGEEAAAYFRDRLVALKFSGNPVFTVADLQELRKAGEEYLDMAVNPPLIAERLMEIGRILGVKGVYTGTILDAGSDTTATRDRSTACLEYSQGICIREQKIITRCSGVAASFSAHIRLIDVATGRNVYADTISGAASDEDCSEQDVTGRSTKQILVGDAARFVVSVFSGSDEPEKRGKFAEALDDAFNKVMHAVFPYTLTVQIPVLKPAEENITGSARRKILDGVAYAGEGNLLSACGLWSEAGSLRESSPSVLHNLGVCEELKGDLQEAQGLYRRAADLSREQDGASARALDRIRTRLNNEERIRSMGY